MTELSGPLGLCIRARACSYGFENTQYMMQKKRSFLVLVDKSISENSLKRIQDKCNYYDVDIVKLDLSEVKDKLRITENVRIISINDINFKKLIEKRLKGET